MNLILICGENSFFCREKLKEVLEKVEGETKVFDAENFDFKSVLEEIKKQDLFSPKQKFVFENFLKDESFLKKLEKEKVFYAKNKYFIFFEPETKLKKATIDFFKKRGEVFLFPKPNLNSLKKWAKEKLSKAKIETEEKVIEKILEECNFDPWQVEKEVEKLMAYKRNQKITLNDVEKLIFPNLELNVFQFLDALFSKERKLALCLLEKIFQKEDPMKIFNLILFYLRNLALVKTAKPVKISSFLIKKFKILARKFDLRELKAIYQRMAQGDILIKSGKVDPKIFLENLVIFSFREETEF